MRPLNLTRLARSSEAKFVTQCEADAVVASARRAARDGDASPPPTLQQAVAPPRSTPPPSVDVVASIAGHAAHAAVVAAGARAALAARTPPMTARALPRPRTQAQTRPPPARKPDPAVMRVLSANRLGVYYEMKARAGSVPSASAGAQAAPDGRVVGAVVGVQAFGVATAGVGAVGLALVGYLYFSPTAVDGLRRGTVGLRGWLEDGVVGRGVRGFSGGEGVISDETRARLRTLVRKAAGMPEVDVWEDEDGEEKGDG